MWISYYADSYIHFFFCCNKSHKKGWLYMIAYAALFNLDPFTSKTSHSPDITATPTTFGCVSSLMLCADIFLYYIHNYFFYNYPHASILIICSKCNHSLEVVIIVFVIVLSHANDDYSTKMTSYLECCHLVGPFHVTLLMRCCHLVRWPCVTTSSGMLFVYSSLMTWPTLVHT